MGGSKKHTLPARLVAYLETLTIRGGDRAGQPFKVLGWERRLLRGVFTRDGNAAVSVARGNGKSGVCAGIASAVVDPEGPLHGVAREVVCAATSFEQSRIIFEDVLGYLTGKGYDLDDRSIWRKQDSANRAWLEHRESGARVRCVGADPGPAHGLRPFLVLADEPSEWERASRDRMLVALETGMGKVPGSRIIALGTRPAAEGHWFAKWLGGNGVSYAQIHAADPSDPPFRISTWRKANPSLDHLPSLRAKLEEEAVTAKRDPEMLAAFRARRLNLGTADVGESLLLEAELWEAIMGDAPADGPCYWGVDLSTSAAQSAIAAYWPRTKRLEVVAAFPNDPSLIERGLRDGVGRLYQDCADRGELLQLGGAAVDVAALVRAARERWGAPLGIACDRWREAELRDALQAAALPVAALELRGQGFRDGAEDVRSFRRACLEGKVTPVQSVLLASAMAAARTVSDPSGNSKLSKGSEGGRRLRARDDAAAAAILAVALAERHPAPARRPRRSAVVA